MWYLAIGVVIFAFVLFIGKKLAPKKKESSYNYKRLKDLAQHDASPKSKRVVAFLNKDMDLVCLEEDGKLYGVAFKNRDLPVLPHADNCQCFYSEIDFRISEVFSENKRSNKTNYKTDIGELDFYSYKYYKYRLLEKLVDDPAKKEEFRQLSKNLNVAASINLKIEQHLQN